MKSKIKSGSKGGSSGDSNVLIGIIGVLLFVGMQRAQANVADTIEDCILNDLPLRLPDIDPSALSAEEESMRLAMLLIEDNHHPEIEALNLRAKQGMAWITAYSEAENKIADPFSLALAR